MQIVSTTKGMKMAICYASLSVIGLGQNRQSPMAMAFYIERAKGKDELTGISHDYEAKKADFVTSKIIIPKDASDEMLDFRNVWKKAIYSEKNKDPRAKYIYKKNAQFAYDIILALPKELKIEDQVNLLEKFIYRMYVNKGVLAHYAIHHPIDNDNPHAHILVSTRAVIGNKFGRKVREINPKFNVGYLVKDHSLGSLTPEWIKEQNSYFSKNNIDLSVDPEKLVPERKIIQGKQKELIRNQNTIRKEISKRYAEDPVKLFEFMEKKYSYFSLTDIKKVLKVNGICTYEEQKNIISNFLNLQGIIKLKDTKGQVFFTTERRRYTDYTLSNIIKNMSGDKGKNITTNSFNFIVNRLIENNKPDTEKENVVKAILEDSSQLVAIKGRAGTGKSFIIELLKKSYDLEGFNVIGLSPTHAVCNDLRGSSFENVFTTNSLSYQIEKNIFDFKSDDVVIIDEAGMVASDIMLPILENAYKNNAKVIMVGDDRQLSSIDAGGCFSEVRRWVSTFELETVYRQDSEDDKKATHLFGIGQTKEALNLYKSKEIWSKNLFDDVVSRWKKSRHNVILAFKNNTVTEVNKLIQNYRIEEKEVKKVISYKTNNGNINIGIGDKIVLTEKYGKRTKGDIGTILGLGIDEIIIDFGDGEVLFASTDNFKDFDLGYAVTVHKSQGKTYDNVMSVVDSRNMWCSELAYVSYTRHKHNLDIVVDEKQFSNVEKEKELDVSFDGKEYFVVETESLFTKEYFNPRDVFLSVSSQFKGFSMHLHCDEYAEQERNIREVWESIDDNIKELTLLEQLDYLEIQADRIKKQNIDSSFKDRIKSIRRQIFSNNRFRDKISFLAYSIKKLKLFTSLHKVVMKNKKEHNNQSIKI